MSQGERDPSTTLVVILGASQFPESSSFTSSSAFKTSALSVLDYFTDPNGFGCPQNNVLFLFDEGLDPNSLDKAIRDFLTRRTLSLKSDGRSISDLLIYYIGHGDFDDDRNYFLAIKTTRDDNLGVSSYRLRSLATTLANTARWIRVYLILDACFSGEATKNFQSSGSSPTEMLKDQVDTLLPGRGVSLLCSSASTQVSLIVTERNITMFTEGVIGALRHGDSTLHAYLTLEELHELSYRMIMRNNAESSVRPELHSPSQLDGDISRFPLFPNPKYVLADSDELDLAPEEREQSLTDGEAEESLSPALNERRIKNWLHARIKVAREDLERLLSRKVTLQDQIRRAEKNIVDSRLRMARDLARLTDDSNAPKEAVARSEQKIKRYNQESLHYKYALSQLEPEIWKRRKRLDAMTDFQDADFLRRTLRTREALLKRGKAITFNDMLNRHVHAERFAIPPIASVLEGLKYWLLIAWRKRTEGYTIGKKVRYLVVRTYMFLLTAAMIVYMLRFLRTSWRTALGAN